MIALRPLERVTRTAALGLRFWDTATATSAIDGLFVEIFPRSNPRTRRVAQANRSGIYIAHAVPRLRDFEFDGTDALWSMETREYRVEVHDPLGRFLPIAFDADLPARGLFTWLAPWFSPPRPLMLPGEPGSPPQLLLERVPLFSAPSRPVPEPLAVVRAHLRAPASRREAAWSLLGISIDGDVRGVGMADEHGRVAVMFPYPEPPRMSLTSPPEARNDFTWEVELTAYGSIQSPPALVPDIPDLADLFSALATPRAIDSVDSPANPFRLTYREELTVRTPGAVGEDASYLSLSA